MNLIVVAPLFSDVFNQIEMTRTCFSMQVGIDISIFKLITEFDLAAEGSLGNLVEVITGYCLFCYLFDLDFLYNSSHIFFMHLCFLEEVVYTEFGC